MVRPVYLLYTLPVRDSSDLRMSDPRVLRNLAEQILAVDWLQSPSKQAIEVKPSLRELYFLPVGHPLDHVFRGTPTGRAKTLGDAVQRARPGDHKLGLVEIEQRRVVEVDRILESEETAESGIPPDALIYRTQIRCLSQSVCQAIGHHKSD